MVQNAEWNDPIMLTWQSTPDTTRRNLKIDLDTHRQHYTDCKPVAKVPANKEAESTIVDCFDFL